MIIELLRKLEAIGYQVSLNGDKISLDFIGASIPPDEVIVTLVESLRRRKAEVVQFLRQGDYEAAFNKAVGGMSREHKPGFFDRARLQRPGKFSRFMVCEDRVNQFWDAGDFESFERALKEWWDFYRSMSTSFGSGNRG